MDTIESEEKIVWSNGMIYLAEKYGFGNLGTIIAWISESRPLLFFGIARGGVHDYRVDIGCKRACMWLMQGGELQLGLGLCEYIYKGMIKI